MNDQHAFLRTRPGRRRCGSGRWCGWACRTPAPRSTSGAGSRWSRATDDGPTRSSSTWSGRTSDAHPRSAARHRRRRHRAARATAPTCSSTATGSPRSPPARAGHRTPTASSTPTAWCSPRASSTCTPTPTCSAARPGPPGQDQPGRDHRAARPGRAVLRPGRRRRAGDAPAQDRRLERRPGPDFDFSLAQRRGVPRPAGRGHRRQRRLPGPARRGAGAGRRAGTTCRRPPADIAAMQRDRAHRDGARARSACRPG